MQYIEAPHPYSQHVLYKSVYLAGGITNCPDWQQQMVHLLDDTDYTLLNPRRQCFPISDPNASREQITWEYHYMSQSIYFHPSSNTFLLAYQHLTCCGKVACCQSIEIQTACDRFTERVSPIPIRRTAPSLIHSCSLMSEC